MRGVGITLEALFSTVHLDTFVPAGHPLRAAHEILDEAMQRLGGLSESRLAAASVLLHPP